MTPACRHCGRPKVNRPLGLCWTCYYKPGVRELYPSTSKYVARPDISVGQTPGVAGGMTQAEVAAALGVSKSLVSQTEARALAKLRDHPVMRRLAEECGICAEES